MIVTREIFFKVQAKFSDIPFNQTEEWMESNYNDHLTQIIYLVDDVNNPAICSWGISFNRKFLGKHLILEGESVISHFKSNHVRDFYKNIIDLGFSLVNISSINFYDANYEIGVRRAGFVRPLGLSLCPLTLLINLQEPFSFHRNWKRNVKKAISENISFKALENLTDSEIENFINLFNELKERKNLSFTLDLNSIKNLLIKGNYKLFFIYDQLEVPVAGRIVYISNNKSYDVYAANSNFALKSGGVYFLQEQLLNHLKEEGIETFDYGRIPPSNDETDAIYVAKSYSNGTPISYNGQWQFSENNLSAFIISFLNFFVRKNKRY